MKNLLIIFLFILSNISIASTCSLPSGENLVIGCATKCDWSTKRALQKISSKLGYKLELVDMPKRAMNQSYETIDGIVIPGGEDIDPIHYKYEVEEELRRRIEDLDHLVDYTREGAKRDKFELEMLKNYFQDQENENLPLLGICRGMQIITVSQKIPLYIDIKAELGIANRRNLKDRITITDSTSLIQNLLETVSFELS